MGAAALRAARAVVRCIEPLCFAWGLAPDGLPSLAQYGRASCAGGHHEGGPSRGRGSRALMSVAGTRPTVPLDELARRSRTPLRCVTLTSAALEPDRHPGHPPCPEPGRRNANADAMSARAGSTAAPVAARGGTSAAEAPVLVKLGGPFAAAVAPAAPSRRPRFLGPSLRRGRCPVAPVGPTAIPPTAPPSLVRGTCGGIFNAVGRQTGSPFFVLASRSNSHPTPRPPQGGSEESEQKDQFSAARCGMRLVLP
jgi:hypothetical protein